jgi:hypothetical protein
MILEAILGVEGPRFAPMGVEVKERGKTPVRDPGILPPDADVAVLRPFFTSRTGAALLAAGSGVLNFADDSFLFAQTALTDELPPSRGPLLDDVPCSWVISVLSSGRDEMAGRWLLRCRVDEKNYSRPSLPFNRGMAAVIEAAILATRIGLCCFDAAARLDELEAIAGKTGGVREIEAFKLIRSKIQE